MDHGHQPTASTVSEALPERLQADREVAAGSVAGVCAGAVAVLAAMAGSAGFLQPLRLVATSLLGPSALDTGAVVGPVAVGMLLVAMLSVLFGLVYVSLLPARTRTPAAVLVGLVYAGAVWVVAWQGVARVLAPILYAAGERLPVLGLHALFGALLGLLAPFLRKILP